jgi:hypothetical protein
MELRDALTQIAEIRQQVAKTECFRGYRALPVAFSGFLALTTAGVQAFLLADPAEHMSAYLALWIGSACLSVLATGSEMIWSLRRNPSPLERQRLVLAVQQFVPSLVAGAVLLIVLFRFAPESLWMLPGLWAMLFGLGIFASLRLLPAGIFWVGCFYLAAGALCLALARDDAAFSPWAMGLPFGAGQLLAAAILYWSLERSDAKE